MLSIAPDGGGMVRPVVLMPETIMQGALSSSSQSMAAGAGGAIDPTGIRS